MYQRYKERFGTAGVLIGVIALVLALVTGAYAAGGGLSGKQKKEVEKIAKKFQGTGPAGAAGANGTNGSPGANGSPGTPGTGVTAASFEGSQGTCEEEQGGVEFKSASATTYACNGLQGHQGAKGEQGEPWPAGGTLPPGATEQGAWSVLLVEKTGAGITQGESGISFGIPLKQAPAAVYVAVGETGVANCPGTFGEPQAEEGFLCMYAIQEPPAETFEPLSINGKTFGALLTIQAALANDQGQSARGSWAVTAPAE